MTRLLAVLGGGTRMRTPLVVYRLLCTVLLLMFCVFSWAGSSDMSSNSASRRIIELNHRIAEAQRKGDAEALHQAMQDYESGSWANTLK